MEVDELRERKKIVGCMMGRESEAVQEKGLQG